MQFSRLGKIVAAGTLAGLMLGSTIGFAALDAYPAPFVTSAGVQSLVVVGSQGTDPAGLASDVAGAIDIAARLGGEVTTEITVPGAAAAGSVVGEGRSINTVNEQIFLGNSLKKTGLRTALSDTDLPATLKSGTVTDSDAGTTYDYDQFIDFPNAIALAFTRLTGKTPNMNDPQYLFDLDTTASTTTSFYRSRVVFNDEVNVTTVAGEDINLFGKEYTFSADSVINSKVILLGSSDTRTLSEGESVDTVIDGVPHTVKLLSVGSASNVGVQVDADSKSIDKSKTATVGGIDVFVDDIFFSSKEGTVSSAKLFIGARKLILQDDTNVKTKIGDQSEKTVDGTFVDLSFSTGKLVRIDVYTNAQNSNTDFLAEGGTFPDIVWKSFTVAFPSVTAPVGSTTREKIEILPSGTKDVALTMTTERGDTNTVKFAHLNTANALNLADQDADPIIVVEGDLIDKNQFFVIDSGDFSRMFEVTSVSSLGSSDAEITIRDMFSGNSIDVEFGADNSTSKVIDGQTYFFNASGAVSSTDLNLRVTWGDGSTEANNSGVFRTVYPTLRTKNRARLAFTTPVTVTNLTNRQSVQLPTGAINFTTLHGGNFTITPVTTERGDATVLVNAAGTSVSSLAVGGEAGTPATVGIGKTASGLRWYQIDPESTNGTVTFSVAKGTNTAKSAQTNSTVPGVLLVEEEDDDSNINNVFVDIGTDVSSGDNRTNANAPDFSSPTQGTGTLTRDANTDISWNTDLWGTLTQRDVGDQDKVRIWYPDDQVSANVFILAEGATVSTTAGVAGTVRSAVPIKTSIAKLDSEVTSADRSNKHLILVGGPAVNSLVRELAAGGKTWTQAQYQTQGAGTAVLNLVENAFASGRSALVIAGHSAADTRTVSGFLQNFDAHKAEFAAKNLVVYKNGVLTTTTA